MENWFKKWFNSSYYHLLYFNRNDEEAANFINKLINYLNPETGSRMLDVACGKGRHSLQLADKGFDVTGIDLSEESIIEAQKNERVNLHFFKHDMRFPFWSNYFEYVFNFFTSFGYFETQRENNNAIRTISKALKPGGIFVIDYLNTAYAETNMVSNESKTIKNVNFTINKWSDEKFFYKKIDINDDTPETPLTFTERVSKFSAEQFKEMFSIHGLAIKEIFGDYNLNPYNEKTSPRLIIVTKKEN